MDIKALIENKKIGLAKLTLDRIETEKQLEDMKKAEENYRVAIAQLQEVVTIQEQEEKESTQE